MVGVRVRVVGRGVVGGGVGVGVGVVVEAGLGEDAHARPEWHAKGPESIFSNIRQLRRSHLLLLQQRGILLITQLLKEKAS